MILKNVVNVISTGTSWFEYTWEEKRKKVEKKGRQGGKEEAAATDYSMRNVNIL